ncbi:aldo/keto reductase [Phenylobacterium sp.]|jgi:aryl-alcohol dehydrogenase-like predicted oxidoreductase|uniref:aldo/keto reductase n=1 Tax=Phenylobacterium sp. TaxID=1871053 RepID=UPI002E373C41|nr:aldo/keto reductase [Phenylobacterium sp.]HEX2560408.1 aldo/keto reductase [Phenylobacterium sp.]
MLYRPLGRTGLTVSEIGLGCASWWGMKAFPEAEACALVHAAIDRGVTFFDTGGSYSHGEAEPRLGRALAGRATDRLVIATKAGTYHAGGGRIARDFSPAAVAVSLERSLRNLGVEAVGLLQLHGPAVGELTDELLATLQGFKDRGLSRAVGLNSFDPRVIEHALTLPVFDVVMVDYNVLRPEREPLIARAAAAGKGVLAGMALAMGHTGRQVLKLHSPRDVWYALRALKNHRADVARGARFGFLHRLEGMTGPQAALAYVLANPNVACAVVGTTRMAHLLENLGASGRTLNPELLGRIRAAQG